MKHLLVDPVIPFGVMSWMAVRENKCHLIYFQLMSIWQLFHQMETGLSIIITMNMLSISEIFVQATHNFTSQKLLSFTMIGVGVQIANILYIEHQERNYI